MRTADSPSTDSPSAAFGTSSCVTCMVVGMTLAAAKTWCDDADSGEVDSDESESSPPVAMTAAGGAATPLVKLSEVADATGVGARALSLCCSSLYASACGRIHGCCIACIAVGRSSGL